MPRFDDDRDDLALAREVASGLRATSNLIETLLKEVRENTVSVASIRAELGALKDNMSAISKIVRDGDGLTVMTRLSLLENSSQRMETDRDKKIEKNWALMVAVVSGLIALAGVIFELAVKK